MPTVFLNERLRRMLLVGSRGLHPSEMFQDFYSMRSPFVGFSVIQSGYWPDFNLESFFSWEIYLENSDQLQTGVDPCLQYQCLSISRLPQLSEAQLRTTVSRSGFYKKNGASVGHYFLLCPTLLLFPIGCFLDKLFTSHQEYLGAGWSFSVQYYLVERQIFIIHKFGLFWYML